VNTIHEKTGKRPVGDRLIRASMTVAVLGVALVAGWVSYWHAVEVIRRYGAEEEPAVYLIPLTIDGMIYASSMSMLWSARHRLKAGRLSRTALVVGIAATVATNLLQGLEHGPLAAVIAAWPAIALVISYELTMWVVRSSREIADRQTSGAAVPDPAENWTGPTSLTSRAGDAEPQRRDFGETTKPPGNQVAGPTITRRRAVTPEDKLAQARERLGQARKLDAEHRARRGRPISAENLARSMRIAKPQALELVKTVRHEVAHSPEGTLP
jgi:hypothetical protein